MYKTIVTRHVKTYGNGFTYYVSLAGEKLRGGFYPGHVTAAYEAELFKWYVRHKYGVTWHTMRARVPDTDLQEYARERGFELTLLEVFQHLPEKIRDKLTWEGIQIAKAFADLEQPLKHKQLVQEAIRGERQGLKRERLAYKDKLSRERAIVWREAQTEVAKAWGDAKASLERLREIRDCLQSALDGASDWQERAKKLLTLT